MEPPSSFKETTPTSSPPPRRASPTAAKKHKRKATFFKRISAELSSLIVKLKALSDAAFSDDEIVDELFDSGDGGAFGRFLKGNLRAQSKADQEFASDYQLYQSLDKIYEAKHPNMEEIAKHPNMDEISVADLGSKNIKFQDLDIVRLRDDMETRVKTAIVSDTSTDSSSPVDNEVAQQNIGETLWEYRRAKWLAVNDDVEATKLEELGSASIKQIPKELYPRIYNNFVERSKPLKAGKRINLEDLINIINSGWINDEKWLRAARGLA